VRWDHARSRESLERWALAVALAHVAALSDLLKREDCGERYDPQKAASEYLFTLQRELTAAFAEEAMRMLDAALADAKSSGVPPVNLGRALNSVAREVLEEALAKAADAAAAILEAIGCRRSNERDRALKTFREQAFLPLNCSVGFPFGDTLWLECARPIRPVPPSPRARVLAPRTPSSVVQAGGSTGVSMETTPGVGCAIRVQYEGRDELAAGLEPKVADPLTGVVTWTWTVDPRAPSGDWPIAIECGDLSYPTEIVIRATR
jgi:hypothetical protein